MCVESVTTDISFVTTMSLGSVVSSRFLNRDRRGRYISHKPSNLDLNFTSLVSPGPLSDLDSPESMEYTASLEQNLQTLPALNALRNREDTDEWYETRPYQFYPEERRMSSLTAGALRGPGKLALLPLMRVKKDESESYVFLHLGRGLCGHDGIIHGGLLATLLDESLWRMVRTIIF